MIVLVGALGVSLMTFSARAETSDADARFAHATDAFRQGEYSEAENTLSKLTQDFPQKGLYWFNLGNVLYLEKKFGPASQAYEQVVTLGSPLSAAAKLGKAKSLRQTGDLTGAWKTISELQQTVPQGTGLRASVDSEVDTLSGLSKKKGVAAYHSGRYSEALTYFTLLHEYNSTDKSDFLRAMSLYYLHDDRGQ